LKETLKETVERIENTLWDIITEFHFLLRDMNKWSGNDIILNDKLRRLHDKLKEMVLDIVLECERRGGN
jgi:hypothetical protein